MGILNADSNCIIKDGFLYLPLLYSPEVYSELNQEVLSRDCKILEDIITRTVQVPIHTPARASSVDANKISGTRPSILGMPAGMALKEVYVRTNAAIATVTNSIARTVSKPFIKLGHLIKRNKHSQASQPQTIEETIVIGKVNYIKTIDLESFTEHFDIIHPQRYEAVKKEILTQSEYKLEIRPIDRELETLVFEVLPMLLKTKDPRQKVTSDNIIDYINKNIRIPQEYERKAETYLGIQDARAKLNETMNSYMHKFPQNKKTTVAEAEKLCKSYIARKILQQEDTELLAALSLQRQLLESGTKRIAALLYIRDRGIDLNGVGILRKNGAYSVYKKIEEYALMDFYRESVYHFPSCRVAVNLRGINQPYIVDSYAHPFLSGNGSGQVICIRHRQLNNSFTAENVLAALEAGINTMLYGYVNARDFNGYHRLEDRNYTKISKSDRSIKSGKLVITNEPFI